MPKIQFVNLLIYLFASVCFWNETSLLAIVKKIIKATKQRYKVWKLEQIKSENLKNSEYFLFKRAILSLNRKIRAEDRENRSS